MAPQFSTKAFVTGKSFNLQHALRPLILVNSNISENRYHPLHEKVLRKLETQDKPQLIINITATIKKTSSKAVVRKKSVHRVREATYQILKEKGYGKDGKAEDGRSNLVGTLAFRTTAETVLTPWEELKEEVRGALGKWIVLRQKSSGSAKNEPKKEAKPGLPFQQDGGGYTGREERIGRATGGWGYERGARKRVGVGAREPELGAGGVESGIGVQGGQRERNWGGINGSRRHDRSHTEGGGRRGK